MSKAHLTAIVNRALTDDEFRALLQCDPDTALADYELDENEDHMVRHLPDDAFDDVKQDPRVRKRRRGFWGRFSLMGSKNAVDASSALDLLRDKYGDNA